MEGATPDATWRIPAGGARLRRKHYELDRDQKKHLRFEALRGVELVPGVSRLCAMNLLLHGVGPTDSEHEPPIVTDDALRSDPSDRADVVVTNPPFGKKSSVTVVNEEGDTDKQTLTYNRPDFWTTTSNKQLNFVQHVKSLLKVHGRAAIVVPDNVLFEGGAGETVRRCRSSSEPLPRPSWRPRLQVDASRESRDLVEPDFMNRSLVGLTVRPAHGERSGR